jgi:uncharacterized membrane protein
MPLTGLIDPLLLKALGVFAISFLVLDLIFLGVLARSFYRRELGSLLLDKFNGGAAAAFYVAYVVSFAALVLVPALEHRWPLSRIGLTAAIFGFAAYATYNLTNLATLKGWPRGLVAVDITWGTFLTGLSAAVAAYVVMR